MRLIDADDLINNLVNACNNDQSKIFPVWIEKQIDAQPTQESVIDALKSDLDETLAVLGAYAEIVQCRYCKKKGTLSCPKAPVRPDDWFCADGERKSNIND